jgi:hypothetical protein
VPYLLLGAAADETSVWENRNRLMMAQTAITRKYGPSQHSGAWKCKEREFLHEQKFNDSSWFVLTFDANPLLGLLCNRDRSQPHRRRAAVPLTMRLRWEFLP